MEAKPAKNAHQFGLSKSKISAFEQCPKRLWLSVHRPQLGARNDDAHGQFSMGHQVGAIARALLPNGVIVEAFPDLSAAVLSTKFLLDGPPERPIFEATLEHEGVLARIDILEPADNGAWRMVEVKSSTKPKDYHLSDLATQLWVAQQAGLSISGAAIRHVDSSFVLESDGDFRGLFSDADLMAEAEPIVAVRGDVINDARQALSGGEPAIEPGPQCTTPFQCEFSEYCHSSLPPGPEWPVSVLPNGGGKRWIERGINNLLDVDVGALTNVMHRRVYQATVSGKIYFDVTGARASIDHWAFPRTWLDFETIGFAVPRWIGTSPYQQVPFQFSAHVECEDGKIDHQEFLSLDGNDPRRRCAEALIMALPKTGAVIGYNANFEKGRILEFAAAFPDLAEELREIAKRIVDLLPITRSNWYHRDQRGSWSIKTVLPTVAPELDYSGLEVKDGVAAQDAYLEAISPGTTDERRAVIDAALRAYCKRDTHAMIVLAKRLCTEMTSAEI